MQRPCGCCRAPLLTRHIFLHDRQRLPGAAAVHAERQRQRAARGRAVVEHTQDLGEVKGWGVGWGGVGGSEVQMGVGYNQNV